MVSGALGEKVWTARETVKLPTVGGGNPPLQYRGNPPDTTKRLLRCDFKAQTKKVQVIDGSRFLLAGGTATCRQDSFAMLKSYGLMGSCPEMSLPDIADLMSGDADLPNFNLMDPPPTDESPEDMDTNGVPAAQSDNEAVLKFERELEQITKRLLKCNACAKTSEDF